MWLIYSNLGLNCYSTRVEFPALVRELAHNGLWQKLLQTLKPLRIFSRLVPRVLTGVQSLGSYRTTKWNWLSLMIRATSMPVVPGSLRKEGTRYLSTSSSSLVRGGLSQCLLHWEYSPLCQSQREGLPLTLPRDSGKVQIMQCLLTSKWSPQRTSFPPSKLELFVARSSRQQSRRPSAIAGIEYN